MIWGRSFVSSSFFIFILEVRDNPDWGWKKRKMKNREKWKRKRKEDGKEEKRQRWGRGGVGGRSEEGEREGLVR